MELNEDLTLEEALVLALLLEAEMTAEELLAKSMEPGEE